MKAIIQNIFVTFSFCMVILSCVAIGNAQTSSFTYQGKLTDNNLPATGTYQMQIGLFDNISGGSQIGGTQSTTVTVANGIFTIELNFGETAFDGTDRFLQIGVFSSSTNAFITLNPRQRITSSPYSIKSSSADTAINASNLGGIPADQFVVTSDPRMTDARPPTAGSNLYIQNSTHQATADISIGGSVTANGFDSNLGYYIGGGAVLTTPGGSNNIFVGLGAGLATTSGTNNSFFGTLAGTINTTGANNSVLGFGANTSVANLNNATAIGAGSIVSASNTIMLGRSGGQDTVQVPGILNAANQYNLGGSRVLSVAGVDNTFAGRGAGSANTSGNSNAFFGRNAGLVNTIASSNSFFGTSAGQGNVDGANNSFFGRSAGQSNTSGSDNSFFGRSAGAANTIGEGNSFFGRLAGVSTNSGGFNSFFGYNAGDSNTIGTNNNFFGAAAGGSNTTGSSNTFIGLQAGEGNIDGDQNVFVGNNAGNTNTTGSSNTYIGYNAKGNAGITNATAIGANAFVFQSNQIVIGTDSNSTIVPGNLVTQGATITNGLRLNVLSASGNVALCRNVAFDVATCSSSLRYKTNIAGYSSGLSLVNRLRPITFDWKEGGMHDLGLGAEDVAAVEPLLVHYNKEGEVEGVKYDRVAVILLNAVKEQQTQIEQQQKQLQQQQILIDGLKKLVCQTNAQTDVCKEVK